MPKQAPDGVLSAADGDTVLQQMSETAVAAYGARGLVTMIVNDDNSFRYFAHGLSHAQINNALAVGIHMNMLDHDKKVAEAALRDRQNQGDRS